MKKLRDGTGGLVVGMDTQGVSTSLATRHTPKILRGNLPRISAAIQTQLLIMPCCSERNAYMLCLSLFHTHTLAQTHTNTLT